MTEDTRPDRRGAKGQGVADRLSDAILDGRLAPGQRLVEVDLTRALGVSRGPIREALRRLAAEGLVELVPNRGALVRRLAMTEALELFEIRTELEAFAARRAAANMRDACVRERFERAVAPIWDEAPRHSTMAYLAENQRFHAGVLDAAGNAQLVALSRRLQLSLMMARIGGALDAGLVTTSIAEHRAITRALRARDGDAAERAMRDHLGRAMAFVAALPASVFRADPVAEQARPRLQVR
jgi:DNA-binding GntR family transcriptional regulator